MERRHRERERAAGSCRHTDIPLARLRGSHICLGYGERSQSAHCMLPGVCLPGYPEFTVVLIYSRLKKIRGAGNVILHSQLYRRVVDCWGLLSSAQHAVFNTETSESVNGC